MGEPFTTAAKTPGNCVICGKGFQSGETLHMQNLGDDSSKKWIVSPHQECFDKLKANPELMKQAYQKKGRSPEERFQDAVSAVDKLWTVCVEKSNHVIEQWFKDGIGNGDIRREKLILAEVYLKAMVEVYAR
jgi:hypothetical protein